MMVVGHRVHTGTFVHKHTRMHTRTHTHTHTQAKLRAKGVEVVEFDFLTPEAVADYCYDRGFLQVRVYKCLCM